MNDPARSLGAIESPCIGTCTLGPEGLCLGCFRSAEEIGAWLSYAPARRRAIMAELPDRAGLLFEDD
ncbi:MAG: DUF1289 domain-containing protein [Wenzhouxiangella sp.]|nr:DUF1289 domain-containing protein [Wenzhouxiangella sp.]MCH8476856.1 DUF1289 domain-containing protein [Wenzhouxiangella sp.]TVR94820.1 MAG: DUF1289 domain-containing protein [Wenzhouxiangellaceae bacterium]